MVTFKKLELKNFKSYKNVSIDFKNGVTMIMGENGAGKSSIFEAISFALFKKSTTNISSLVRTGIDEKEKMSVLLEFNINGEDYIVSRVKAKSSSSAELSKKQGNANVLLATGDRNVNSEIIKILGIDDDLFLNAIYVRQGEIADLVNKTSSERKKLIGKLLNLESLEQAWKDLPVIINTYETSKAELKGKLSNEQELQYDLNRRLEDKETLNIEKNKTLEDLAKLKEDLDKNTNKLKQMEDERKQYLELKAREDKTKTLLSTFQSEKQKLNLELDDIIRSKDEMKRLEKYVTKLPIYQEFKDIYYKLKSIQEEKNILKEKIDEINKLKENIKEEKPYYDSYLKVEAGIKEYSEKKLELEKNLEQYRQLDIQRLNYQQEVKNEKAELKNFISEIKETIKDTEDKTLDEYKNIILHFEGENTEKITKLKEKLTHFKGEIAILKSKIKDANNQLKDLDLIKDECPVCKSQITNDKKEELNKNYTDLIKQANERISFINQEILKLNKDLEILESSQKTLNSINNRFYNYQRINESINTHEEAIKKLTGKIILKKDTDAELVKVNRNLEALEKDYKDLKTHYEKYQLSQGKLLDLGNENEINDRLYSIHGQNDIYVSKLRECIRGDMFLTETTPITEVDNKIKELSTKKERYDQLKGKVLGEDSLKTKIDEKTNEININQQSLKNIQEELSKTLYDEIKYQQIKNSNETLNQNYNSLAMNLGQLNGKLEELEKTIENYKKQIEDNKKLKKDLEKNTEFLNFLEDIRFSFSREGVQKSLRELARPLIQKYTKSFFEKFNFNYSDLILNEDFSVSVYGPEGESNLDMVSGGEKIAIAIALRLGITRSMGQGGIDTILLDEPTVHLDTYRRQELVDIISSMNILPQMIIVTHDSELESAADNVITVIKENGLSTVKSS